MESIPNGVGVMQVFIRSIGALRERMRCLRVTPKTERNHICLQHTCNEAQLSVNDGAGYQGARAGTVAGGGHLPLGEGIDLLFVNFSPR